MKKALITIVAVTSIAFIYAQKKSELYEKYKDSIKSAYEVTTNYKGDTTEIHKILEIDGNLIIVDTVKIEKTVVKEKIKEVEKPAKNYSKFLVISLVFLFIVLSIFNAKRNKNLDL